MGRLGSGSNGFNIFQFRLMRKNKVFLYFGGSVILAMFESSESRQIRTLNFQDLFYIVIPLSNYYIPCLALTFGDMTLPEEYKFLSQKDIESSPLDIAVDSHWQVTKRKLITLFFHDRLLALSTTIHILL